MNVSVVIVAAGRGHRLGGETPKQYIPLGTTCSLRRVAEKFLSVAEVSHVVPVIHPDDVALCTETLEGLQDTRLLSPTMGAETRAKSVRCGLESLTPFNPELVLIHDAARPFLPLSLISEVIGALRHNDGACAALPLVDALWSSRDGVALAPVPRNGLWRAQTPQGFAFAKILRAHRNHDGDGTDDVAVAREAGLNVAFVPGTEQNYKITTANDLERAITDAQILDARPDRDAPRAAEDPS